MRKFFIFDFRLVLSWFKWAWMLLKLTKYIHLICVCSALVILRFGVRCWPDPQIFLHQKLFPNLISIKLHRNSLFCLNSSKASQQRMTALLLKQFSITKLFLLSFLLIESNSKLFNANWLQMITAEKSGSLLFSGGQISPIVPGGGGGHSLWGATCY